MHLLVFLALVGAQAVDLDGDGFEPPLDCNDVDAAINPGVPTDVCDTVDNDCDLLVDEDAPVWFEDLDFDQFGGATTAQACPWDPLPASQGQWTQQGGDCDDANPIRHPDMPELCDGQDNDCDADVDEGIPVRTLWPDDDGDGFGQADASRSFMLACPPPGFSPYDDDCDDTDPEIHPLHGADYLHHVPLAGLPPEFSEADRDPAYVGDGIDQDCDGVDLCYQDLDADGFGNPAALQVGPSLDCDVGSALIASNGRDCDDLRPDAFPGGEEVIGDGVDQNCDGRDLCYEDRDGDGWGGIGTRLTDNNLDCDDASAPTSSRGEDCNDDPDQGGPLAHPQSLETCDGIDNNCDGTIDEVTSPDAKEYFRDADGDGFGVATQIIRACGPGAPLGYSERSGDCDDAEPRANPDAVEVCDGIDNNCRSGVDEDAAVDVGTWLLDGDGDGLGDGAVSEESCDPPEGGPWVAAGGELDRCPDDPTDRCAGCSCASGGGGPHLLAMLGVMVFGRRRSR